MNLYVYAYSVQELNHEVKRSSCQKHMFVEQVNIRTTVLLLIGPHLCTDVPKKSSVATNTNSIQL